MEGEETDSDSGNTESGPSDDKAAESEGTGSGGGGGSGGGSGAGNAGKGPDESSVANKQETEEETTAEEEKPALFQGEGTEEAPYLIKNAKDLEKLAELAVSDYDTYGGSCYRLTNNIKMKKGKNNHTPIGSTELPFIGEFDGCGYVISDLSIDESRKAVQGLFGVIGEEGMVRNVGLKENSICGKSDVGAIAGINYGTIESCFQTGDIYGMEDSAGGIAGRNSGTVENCYSTGLVCGGYKTGAYIDTDFSGSNRRVARRAGIRDFIMTVAETVAETIAETVAYIVEETKAGLETIYEIVTTAISPESGEMDLIAGSLEEDSQAASQEDTMAPEDSIGEIETEEKGPGDGRGEMAYPPAVGGLVGINEGGAVTDSYQAGRQAAKRDNWKVGGIAGINADGLLDNCYYVQGAPTAGSEELEYDGVTGVTSEKITGISAIDQMGLDAEIWIGRQADEDDDTETGEAGTIFADAPVRYRHYYPQLMVFEEKGQPYPYTFGLVEVDGLRMDMLSKRAYVSTEDAWEWLFAEQEYMDYEITLEADLDLSGFRKSIGTMEHPFTGTLDGNGYVIRGITKPLFGVLGEGSAVYYLLIDEADIVELTFHGEDEFSSAADGCGVLAAYAQGSVIDSCGAVGNIRLGHGNGRKTYVGGLLGEAVAGTSIYESYSFVNITETLGESSEAVCGGLAGRIGTDAGAVNSYATGRLECSGVTGGFAGENRGEIRDSFVTTIIADTAREAGAFVGYMPGEAKTVSMSIPERELLKAAAEGTEETSDDRREEAGKGTEETLESTDGGTADETKATIESPQTETTAAIEKTLPAETTETHQTETTADESYSESAAGPGKEELPQKPESPATPSQTIQIVPIVQPETGLKEQLIPEAEEWIKENFTITGCAYDAQMSGCTDQYAEGLLTADMIGFEAVLPGGNWYMTEGAYPQLECMACHTHEAYLLCSKASAIPLILPAGITLQDMPDGSEKVVSVSGSLEMGLPPQIDGDPIEWFGSGKVTIQEDGTALLDEE